MSEDRAGRYLTAATILQIHVEHCPRCRGENRHPDRQAISAALLDRVHEAMYGTTRG